jgi:hemolysin activation/secretion protein
MKKIIARFFFFFLMLIFSFKLFAANFTIYDIPTVSDPGLILKRLGKDLPPMRKAAPLEEIKKAPPQAEPSGFEKIHFKLNKIIFKGNTVYSDVELRMIFQPSLGHTISLADLERLVEEVTKKYRSEGYVISRVILPPQVIKNGVVTIQVIEGFISEVKVQGDPGNAKQLFLRYGQEIKKRRPLQISYLERDMLLMNDLPGMTVKSIITPSKNVPGSADLTIVVERKRAGASVSYDNYGTRYIGPQQINVSGSLYSLLMPGDSNTLHYATVPRNTELNFIEFNHTNPIGINGIRFTVGGDYVETHPLFILAPLNVRSRSNFLFTDLSYPLLRSRTRNMYVHTALNYQNITSTILATPFYADRTRSLVLGGNFDFTDRLKGMNNIAVDIEHGFKILGAEKHVNQSRPLGVPNFTKGTLNASRIQWITEKFSLMGGIYGQYSCNPLLASEQYSFGGPDYGRGYDPSQIVGDDGLAGKLELRMNAVPGWKWLNALQGYIFYDAGMIWNRDGQSLPAKQSGTSTGFGARFNFIPQISANFYLAKPLTLPVATMVAMGENGNQIRGFFQMIITL